MQQYSEFIHSNRLKLFPDTVHENPDLLDENPAKHRTCEHYRVKITRNTERSQVQMCCFFSMPRSSEGRMFPALETVLQQLAREAKLVIENRSMERWAIATGRRPDSSAAFYYIKAGARASALRRLLGKKRFEQLLYQVR